MKIEISDVAGGYNIQNINNNFEAIRTELNEKVLYRNNPVGEPNAMGNDLDMNGKRIYNLPMPVAASQAARLQDVMNAISGAKSANLISYVPTAPGTATNVQAAIDYLLTLVGGGSTPSVDSLGVSHVPAGTGALTTTVQAVLRAGVAIKPEWFGADPSGTIDSTAAFVKMAAAAVHKIDMRGTFKVNRSTVFNGKSNLILQGPGTIIADKANWAFTPGVRGILAFTNCTDCGADNNLQIQGVRKSNPAAFQPWEDGDSGIEFITCIRPYVDRVHTRNTFAWGILGIACIDPIVNKCTVKDVTRQSGINMAVGGTRGARVTGNIIENVGLYGIEAESAEAAIGSHYSDNIIKDCQKGIAVVSNISNITVVDNTVESCLYGMTVNNLANHLTKDIVLHDNNLINNWRSVEFAGARGAKALNNVGTHITADTYMHRTSYNAVHTVTGASQFTAINFLNDTAANPVGSTIQMLGVEYTITAVATSSIALYGAIATFTVTPALAAGITEGEMFKTKMLATGSVGFIGATGSTICSVADNTFKDAYLGFQLRGASTGVRVDNNHLVDCATLVWFDTANVGGYKLKGNTHSGAVSTASFASLTAYSANGDVEGHKIPLFAFTKTALGLSKVYYPSSDTEFIYAITMAITDSTCTGSAVLTINGIDTVLFNVGEYVASGAAFRTVYPAAPIKLLPNTIFAINVTDTAGDLAFKHSHITLHVM